MKQLYPHNEQAVKAVAEAFKTQQRAAVVHATGTGKSYIIASVVEAFDKAIVIAPRQFVLDETRKVCKEGTDFMTYTYVAHHYEELPKYDLIVCDEFHHAGSSVWGEGINNLIKQNPQAKVLGTSANSVRYLDNNRNMVEELFDGNMVSQITLGDAISDGLLPMPTYVCSLYTMDETVKQLTQFINHSINSDEEKADGMRKLQGIQENWKNSHGIADIIRKYVPQGMKRMIAFCQTVANIAEAEMLLHRWFYDAGFTKIKFYRISSGEDNNEKEMADFCADDYNGLKICLSVNMLNEGVHVPGVEGVIMMRSTMSRIMAEQQVGRCLTTSNRERKPVVIDLVNNVYYFRDRYNVPQTQGTSVRKRVRQQAQKEEQSFTFDIIDECRDIREFVGGLYETFDTTRWDYESAKKALSKATSYKNAPTGAYAWAYNNGYLEELTAHFDRKYNRLRKYTKEELMEEAKKYKTPYEWAKADSKMYGRANRHPDFLEITAHMTRQERHSYTNDELHQLALSCKSLNEFYSKYKNQVAMARKRGIFFDITSHFERPERNPRPKKYVPTDEEVLNEARKYSSNKDFNAANPSYFFYAFHRGLIEPKPRKNTRKNIKWTEDMVTQIALKYNTRSAFALGEDKKAYNWAHKHGLVDKICKHMKPIIKWTEEFVREEAKKYRSRNQFKECCDGAYKAAKRYGILDEILPKIQ